MTTRNFDALFAPRAIALVGASNEPGSVGQVLARNLLDAGFDGPVMPVNLHARSIRSTIAYRTIGELPQAPDLAVIATPAAAAPRLIAELGARGCRAAIVISAGFETRTQEGRALRQALLDAARPNLLRLLGPNCLGMISPRRRINASFAHLTPLPGELALVSQSGAIAAAAMDWADSRGIGFSQVITLGDAADIDFGDLLDHLALDPETRGILLYLESITDARKFMTAGRIAARAKPVVVVKAGRSAAGAKAAFSHTGAMAGADSVYDAAFQRAGMLRVDGLRELFDAVATLSAGLVVHGDRLAILTNGGGAGVLAADALEAGEGRLAELSAETIEAISRAASPNWSHRNPVDIIGDAPAEAYSSALEAILQDPGADAVLVMNCPTAVTDSTAAGEATLRAIAKAQTRAWPPKPVLTCWLGDRAVAQARQAFTAARAPTHDTPHEAVRAFSHLVRHHRNQQLMLQTPSPIPATPAKEGARAIVEGALRDGRYALTDPEAREVLKAYGVPTIESHTIATAQEAADAAKAFPAPYALKILSRDISHKTEVGGVILGLRSAEDVRSAAEAMLQRVQSVKPEARIDGLVLEPMIFRGEAQELILGIAKDPAFGPVVLFGEGGVAAEIRADKAVALPPLDDILARDMVSRTKVARLLAGYRNRPAADLDAIVAVLIALAQLAIDLPEITELDINPLLADADGVIALDARVGLRPAGDAPRVAILPYPEQLRTEVRHEGETLEIRPIRPQDAPKLVQMVSRSTPDDVRLRFCGSMRTLPPAMAARLTQIDYDREMALVAVDAAGELLGVAWLVSDPEGETAEFAVMVRSDRQSHGLGSLLLKALMEFAQARGLHEVWGDVARDNERMLEVGADRGFSCTPSEDPSRLRLARRLT
jgi:acetyltransferase